MGSLVERFLLGKFPILGEFASFLFQFQLWYVIFVFTLQSSKAFLHKSNKII